MNTIPDRAPDATVFLAGNTKGRVIANLWVLPDHWVMRAPMKDGRNLIYARKGEYSKPELKMAKDMILHSLAVEYLANASKDTSPSE